MDVTTRELDITQWEFFKKVRIAAIDESPTAFKYTPDEARALPDDYWKNALNNDHWYIGTIEGHVVAVGGLMPLKDDPQNYEIASVWIDPEYRGKGAFTEFLNQVIDEARELGIDVLYASIFTENKHSIDAFTHAKFELTGMQESRYQPGRMINRYEKPLTTPEPEPLTL